MILPISINFPEANNNIFNCISHKNEYVVDPHANVMDYMVTDLCRNENIIPFEFVYNLFDHSDEVFSLNQDTVLSIASELFKDADSLNPIEAGILNRTFIQQIKREPTLNGRK
mgnify:CR=1 FL=1